MTPKGGRGRPLKRVAPEVVADVSSVYGGIVSDVTQTDKDRKIERLRIEIQRLQEVTQDRSQTSSTSLPMPSAPEERRLLEQ